MAAARLKRHPQERYNDDSAASVFATTQIVQQIDTRDQT